MRVPRQPVVNEVSDYLRFIKNIIISGYRTSQSSASACSLFQYCVAERCNTNINEAEQSLNTSFTCFKSSESSEIPIAPKQIMPVVI